MFKKFILCLLLVCVFFSCATPKVNAEELQTITKIEQVEDAPIYKTEQFRHALVDMIGTILIGELGFHQFYNGHIFMGILYILTAGLFGIGYVYSIIVTIINFVDVFE